MRGEQKCSPLLKSKSNKMGNRKERMASWKRSRNEIINKPKNIGFSNERIKKTKSWVKRHASIQDLYSSKK